MLLGVICVKPRLVKQTTHLLFIIVLLCPFCVLFVVVLCYVPDYETGFPMGK